MKNEALHALIESQQEKHEGEPLYMVGMQLLEIADREPRSAELLLQDLKRDGMKLSDAAAMLQSHADKIAKPKHLRRGMVLRWLRRKISLLSGLADFADRLEGYRGGTAKCQ